MEFCSSSSKSYCLTGQAPRSESSYPDAVSWTSLANERMKARRGPVVRSALRKLDLTCGQQASVSRAAADAFDGRFGTAADSNGVLLRDSHIVDEHSRHRSRLADRMRPAHDVAEQATRLAERAAVSQSQRLLLRERRRSEARDEGDADAEQDRHEATPGDCPAESDVDRRYNAGVGPCNVSANLARPTSQL